MIAFLSLLLHIVVSPFKTKARLESEIIMLRHQLNVLRRRVPLKPKLVVADRLLFVWLYRLFPSVLNAVKIIQPETIVRWHRTGFRLYWRWKSRSRGGRPRIPGEIRRLIREMSLAVPPSRRESGLAQSFCIPLRRLRLHVRNGSQALDPNPGAISQQSPRQ